MEAPAAEGTRLLYERYHDRVFGYCLYQLGSREEAEDATQTTFMWAFRGLRRGVVPRAEDSWLFTIAKNACRARHRARGRKRQCEVISDPQVLADITPAPSRQHDELIGLEDALARMPELQRRAILLREWRGLSYREIAAELDISGAAVETLIFRARRSLAELLDGKLAPKRARRFAFDFGSIGLALKSALGGASAAKLAAGVVAVLVMATIGAGSVEHPVREQKAPATPVLSGTDVDTTKPVPAAKASPGKGSARAHRADRGDGAKKASPAPSEDSGSAIGQAVDGTTAMLPLTREATDAVPLAAASDLLDDAVEDLGNTVDDVVDTLP